MSVLNCEVFLKAISGFSGAELQEVIRNAKRRIILDNTNASEALFLGVIEQLRKNLRSESDSDLEQGLVFAFHGLKMCDVKKYTYSILEGDCYKI